MATDRATRNAELMRLAEAAAQIPSNVYRLDQEMTDTLKALATAVPDLVRENEEMAQRERIYDAFMGNVEKALKDRDAAMLMAAIQAAHSAFKQVKP